MPHCNNPNAKKRKAGRNDPTKPKFLQRKANKPAVPPTDPDADPDADPVAVAVAPTPAAKVPRSEKAAIITEYHALEKQLASCSDPLEKRMLLARQMEIGGLQAYQEASLHGGDKKRGGESGKWCVTQLKELKVGVDKGKGKAATGYKVLDGVKVYPKVVREKLRLLDVGAIAGTSYADWPWIETTCIDLNPQAPHVQKFDFFNYPVPAPTALFDVVGLSLVINFVGSLTARADMLKHAHSYLKPEGLLYLVLPLPCLTNSRYMTHARFTSILTTLGWTAVKQYDSMKLTYWLLKREGDGKGDGKVWKREEVRSGVRRNNFCVIVGTGAAGEEEEVEEKEAVGDEVAADEDEWVPAAAEAEEGDDGEEWGGC